jgi:hypothetical protein
MPSDNPHVAARMALARKLGAAYAANPKAAVVMAAGSTGRGTADAYSDLELDVYWREPPTADERRAAIEAGGAEVVEIWPYEEDEWAEEMRVGDFKIGTSTFLVSTLERYLGEVLVLGHTNPLAQMRLHSVLNARLLFGDAGLVASWRERAAHYPSALRLAMLRENLEFEGFGYAEDMLAARDDVIAFYDVIGRVARQVMGALLAVNGIYLPNPYYKGVAEVVGSMAHTPPDFLNRLKAAYRLPPPEGVAALHGLIADVFDLVERHVPGFDTGPYRERLRGRRTVWEG